MNVYLDYQRFIDSAIRESVPAKQFGINCDLTPERIHGQLQISNTFIGHELRATVGLCSLLHENDEQMTMVAVILCDSENIPPVVTPMVIPRSVKGKTLGPGEIYVRALVGAWNEVINLADEKTISRQYMLGFLAHCCLEWPEDGADGEDRDLPLSDDGREFAKLAARAFE